MIVVSVAVVALTLSTLHDGVMLNPPCFDSLPADTQPGTPTFQQNVETGEAAAR
jgi:hypothetical protein